MRIPRGKNKFCGVYLITCTPTGRNYVGSSINISLRIRTHIKDLNKRKHCNFLLQRAWNKYNPSNFEWCVLERCRPEVRHKRETFWIKEKKAFEKGFNLTDTGGNSPQLRKLNRKPRTAAQREASRKNMIKVNKEFNSKIKKSDKWKADKSNLMRELNKNGKLWTEKHKASVSKRIKEYNFNRRGKPVKPKSNLGRTKRNDRMTVLVLCHGNVCRSPLAAALMRKHGLEDVHSAGFKIGGTKSPKKVRDWASVNQSVDLNDHRSIEVTPYMLENAEWILYMDGGQKKRLAEMWARIGLYETRGDVENFSEPLGRYLNDPKEKIGDPMFQASGSQAFVEIMEQLVEASKNFVEQRSQAPIVAEA